MDWFKWDADAASNEKLDRLRDGAFRAFLNMCGYAMRHENGGRVPENAPRLIPRVTKAHITELERHGFLHRNGDGWLIHDWDDHQSDALAIQEKRKRDAERKRARRQEGDE